MITGTKLLLTPIDELPEVYIDEDSDEEEELEPKVEVENSVSTPNFETER